MTRRGRGRRPLGRALAAVLAGLALWATAIGPPVPAGAQAPETVRDALAAPGIYVAPGGADVVALAAAVARARQAGISLVVVVAEDPRPDAEAFALRVRQLGVGDPVVVFGPGGQFGVSSEVLTGTELVRAREAAEGRAAPEAATAAFTDALLHDADAPVPGLVDEIVRYGGIALGVLVVSAVTQRTLRGARRRRARRARPLAS